MFASHKMLNVNQCIPLRITEPDRAGVMQAHQDRGSGIMVRSRIRPRPTVEHVGAGTAFQSIGAGAALQNVVPVAAPYPVISVTPVDVIRNGIAGNQIVPGPRNEILNDRIPRNNQVACQAVYIRDALRAQVNPLVVLIRAQVSVSLPPLS